MNKRIILLLASAILSVSVTKAQETGTPTTTALNYGTLENKLTKSNADTLDPKKLGLPKTWLDRGELLQDINDVNIQNITFNMDPVLTSTVMMKKPLDTKTQVIKRGQEEVTQEIQVYDRVNIIFEGGLLVSWVETQVITPNPLIDALSAFNKAVQLDVEKKISKKLLSDLDRLRTQSEQKAYVLYSNQDYKGAFTYFMNYVNCGKVYVYNGVVDTSSLFNAALCANIEKMYPEAIALYEEVKKYNYLYSKVIVSLKECYIAIDDSAKALSTLQDGFKTDPGNIDIINELINYYLEDGKAQEALNYIQLAKQSDPTNKTYYYCEGYCYDKMKDNSNAILSYEGAISIDPEYFEALYNLAIAHHNLAVEYFNAANDPKLSNAEYEKQKAVAQTEFEKALPYMESAHQIRPDDMEAMQRLKEFYFRLQMTDKYEQIKKEIEAAGGK